MQKNKILSKEEQELKDNEDNFIKTHQGTCGWAKCGMKVLMPISDTTYHKKNVKKEGIIVAIDGEYIYIRPLYQKHLHQLYLNEINPSPGFEIFKEDYAKKIEKTINSFKKSNFIV